jgi:hypothetical protein
MRVPVLRVGRRRVPKVTSIAGVVCWGKSVPSFRSIAAVSEGFMQPTGSLVSEGAACHAGIRSWGFDACAVEQALLLAGGNEERAVDVILEGGVASSTVQCGAGGGIGVTRPC